MDTVEQPLQGNVPTVEVACANSGCSRHGIRTWVRLQIVALGFATMPALICVRCGQAALVVRHWQPAGTTVPAGEPAVEEPPAPVVEIQAARRKPGRPRKVRA